MVGHLSNDTHLGNPSITSSNVIMLKFVVHRRKEWVRLTHFEVSRSGSHGHVTGATSRCTTQDHAAEVFISNNYLLY